MARVVRGCSLVLSWGEGEGRVDKGGWGGWVFVASSDVMSAMLARRQEAVLLSVVRVGSTEALVFFFAFFGITFH